MPHLYILKNQFRKHYVGITNLNPKERLKRHNRGDVYSTKFGRPWVVIYSERFETLKKARVKEKQIKSWKGGNAFKKFIFSATGSSNGRTVGFGPAYPGSNPGPVALKKNLEHINSYTAVGGVRRGK